MLDRREFMRALGIGVAAVAVGPSAANALTAAVPAVVRTRTLKTRYSLELVQDLQAYHSIDAEYELALILREQLDLEIGKERGTLESGVSYENSTPMKYFTFRNDGKNGPENNWGMYE